MDDPEPTSTAPHSPDPRLVRLGEIFRGVLENRYPPMGWYREFGVPSGHWPADWARRTAWKPNGTIGDGPEDTFRSGTEWADACAAEEQVLEDIRQTVGTIEMMRADGRPASEQFTMPEPPDPDRAVRRFDERRREKAFAIASWTSIRRVPRSKRAHDRVLTIRCTHGCELLETFSRRDEGTPKLVVIAYRATRPPEPHCALEAVATGEESVVVGCSHGVGHVDLAYPASVRRSGPPPNRRIEDLVNDTPLVRWKPAA